MKDEVVTIFIFTDKETDEIIVCFQKCHKCPNIDKCDHSDPDHY